MNGPDHLNNLKFKEITFDFHQPYQPTAMQLAAKQNVGPKPG